jgi:hypothetical protein
MKFKRAYLQDEMRETQNQQMRLNNLSFINTELAKVKKVLTTEYMVRYINGINEEIGDEDLEDVKESVIDGGSLLRQNMLSDSEANDNSDKQNVSKAKRQEQLDSASKKGKPTGYGKESEMKVLEVKEMLKLEILGKEVKRIPYLNFVGNYSADKQNPDFVGKVFLSEDKEMYRFAYCSLENVYETIVPKTEVTHNHLMGFKSIYRLKDSDMVGVIDSG